MKVKRGTPIERRPARARRLVIDPRRSFGNAFRVISSCVIGCRLCRSRTGFCGYSYNPTTQHGRDIYSSSQGSPEGMPDWPVPLVVTTLPRHLCTGRLSLGLRSKDDQAGETDAR